MITTILVRLKPSLTSTVPTTVAAIRHPAAAAQAISESANLREDANADEFFSFGTAQVTALSAIKDVLKVANRSKSGGGASAVGRNPVPVQVWEGTQWLLRDDDRRVRRTYVDTLLVWLNLEGSKNDARVPDHLLTSGKRGQLERSNSLNKRALSNASHKTKPAKGTRSTFFQLLYLAVYENAHESPSSAIDILLLHLLMTQMVTQLGVNAVKGGLPMIMRLQEDVFDKSSQHGPVARVYLGSLVHGYLWAIIKHFDLETTLPGFEVQQEISKRQRAGLWLNAIQLPPVPLDQIGSAAISAAKEASNLDLQLESMAPFQRLQPLIDQIAQSYSNVVSSPPNSPPGSPGRVFSMPAISSTGSQPRTKHDLPNSYREEMGSKWTQEACISAVKRTSSRATSLHGSRSGTHRSTNNGLLTANGNSPRDASPSSAHHASQLKIPKRGQKELNFVSSPHSPHPRRSSAQTEPSTPVSSSDHQRPLRFDELKRALAGGAIATVFSQKNGSSVRTSSPLRNSSTTQVNAARTRGTRSIQTSVSAGSDSYVDAEGFESASEGDLTQPLPAPESPAYMSEVADQLKRRASQRTTEPIRNSKDDPRPTSRDGPKQKLQLRPRSASTASAEDPDANARALKGEAVLPPSRGSGGMEDDDVPPVPPLPKSPVHAQQRQHRSPSSSTRWQRRRSGARTTSDSGGWDGDGYSPKFCPKRNWV